MIRKWLAPVLAAVMLSTSISAAAAPIRAADSRLAPSPVERQSSRIDDASNLEPVSIAIIVVAVAVVTITIGWILWEAIEELPERPDSPLP